MLRWSMTVHYQLQLNERYDRSLTAATAETPSAAIGLTCQIHSLRYPLPEALIPAAAVG
jgi:hypothetical protein